MTITAEELSKRPGVRKLVLVIDIQSSTRILEDLKRTDNQHLWLDLLESFGRFITTHAKSFGLQAEKYKFIGDGWIFLFPPETPRRSFLEFLQAIGSVFQTVYGIDIVPFQQEAEEIATGLTFGIDQGELLLMQGDKGVEYVGRPLNVASRLQSEARAMRQTPALFSKSAY